MRASVATLAGALILVAGCAAAQERALSKAHAGLETALSATVAAKDALVEWDAHAQAAIVAAAKTEDEGKQALAEYRAARAVVVVAFSEAVVALAQASSTLSLYEAGRENAAKVAEKISTAARAVEAFAAKVKALRAR